jgi:transposase
MRYALNTVAVTAPDWLLAHSEAEWADRYRERASDHRLPK